MALSGGEQTEAQEKIIKGLQGKYPNTSRHYCVRTDTFGSIATAFQTGFWIAHRAIKIVYDAEDGLVAPPYDITVVKKLVWEYFKRPDKQRPTRPPHLQSGGSCSWKTHQALLPKADQSLLTLPGGLHVLAVGSVLIHCWDLLKEGLLEALTGSSISSITIVKLEVSSAFGAAVLGSKAAGNVLNIDLSANTSLLYSGSPGVM
eukprot:Em0013g843a